MDSKIIKWDMLIIIFAIYNSIGLPIEIAFGLKGEFDYIINNVIDIMFLIDILLTFRKTYTDPFTGDEVFDLLRIRTNYFKGNFTIDVLSTVPFEKVAKIFAGLDSDLKKFTVISCLKLIRILRLGRLINYLNESDDFKLQLRLFKLCFILILYIHITACVWFFMCVATDKKWIPAQYDAYSRYLGLAKVGFYDQDVYHKYILTFYNAILQLMGNDISPNNMYLFYVGII